MKAVAIVIVTVFALACAAHATPKNTPAGKLNSEGIAAAKAKDWETAREKFAASFALDADAGTLFNLANAQERTHHLAAAHASYTRYLAISRPGEDDTFRKTATAHLEKIDPQLGSIHLVTTYGPDVAFELDGAPLVRTPDPVFVDPGEHEVDARRGAVVLGKKQLKITAGEAADVELSPALAIDHDVKPPPDHVLPPPPSTAAHHSILRSPWVWGVAAVVIVGASLGGYYELSTKDPMRGTLDPGVIHGP